MRLDNRCVYDLLTYIENESAPDKEIEFPKDEVIPELSQYDFETIKYHLEACERNDLIYGRHKNILGAIKVKDVTPKGRQLIHGIEKNKNRWIPKLSDFATIGELVAAVLNLASAAQ